MGNRHSKWHLPLAIDPNKNIARTWFHRKPPRQRVFLGVHPDDVETVVHDALPHRAASIHQRPVALEKGGRHLMASDLDEEKVFGRSAVACAKGRLDQ